MRVHFCDNFVGYFHWIWKFSFSRSIQILGEFLAKVCHKRENCVTNQFWTYKDRWNHRTLLNKLYFIQEKASNRWFPILKNFGENLQFCSLFLKLAKESISYCEVILPFIETGTTVFTFDQHSMETSGSFTERFFKLAFLCNIKNFSILSNGKITNFRENYSENLSQLVVEIPQRNDEKVQLILPNGLDQALLKSSIFSKFYSNNLFIKNPPI